MSRSRTIPRQGRGAVSKRCRVWLRRCVAFWTATVISRPCCVSRWTMCDCSNVLDRVHVCSIVSYFFLFKWFVQVRYSHRMKKSSISYSYCVLILFHFQFASTFTLPTSYIIWYESIGSAVYLPQLRMFKGNNYQFWSIKMKTLFILIYQVEHQI